MLVGFQTNGHPMFMGPLDQPPMCQIRVKSPRSIRLARLGNEGVRPSFRVFSVSGGAARPFLFLVFSVGFRFACDTTFLRLLR